MRFRIGYQQTYQFEQPTPMIAMLSIHEERAGDLEQPDHMMSAPVVDVRVYRDGFGNWCRRFVAPAGLFTMSANAVIRDSGAYDPFNNQALQFSVENLPSEVLIWLLPSRYCESDRLSEAAWNMFGALPAGWPLIQAICDFVHQHVSFSYEHSDPFRTAAQTYAERIGVCRDFAHLAIAFCRAMNVPARYCTGYISEFGQPLPHSPGDFAAWIEVYLGGRWHVFDPRNNQPRIGRFLVARGRDAADVPLTHAFGKNELVSFEVWTDAIDDAGTIIFS